MNAPTASKANPMSTLPIIRTETSKHAEPRTDSGSPAYAKPLSEGDKSEPATPTTNDSRPSRAQLCDEAGNPIPTLFKIRTKGSRCASPNAGENLSTLARERTGNRKPVCAVSKANNTDPAQDEPRSKGGESICTELGAKGAESA